MNSARRTPTDEEWEIHKADIRRLYLVQELPQKDLLAEVKRLGLNVTKAQLEYRLKLWNLRRNIDKDTWPYINDRIKKRAQAGKKSEVIYCGRRVKDSTVRKETNRNQAVALTVNRDPPPSPPSPGDEQLSICTPAPLPMEFSWPQTLPSLKFQAMAAQNLLAFNNRQIQSLSGGTDMAQLEVQGFSTAAIPYLGFGGIPRQAVSMSRLASAIGRTLPESYPGEHLMRAEILTRGSGPELLRESTMLAVIALSNNFGSCWSDSQWKEVTILLRGAGMLAMPFDFTSLHDVTTSAFMEKLFQGAFMRFFRSAAANDVVEEYVHIIKWLLSSGQNPNLAVGMYSKETPLQLSVRIWSVAMVELLLHHEADPNLVFGTTEPALELAISDISNNPSVLSKIVGLLISAGAGVNGPAHNMSPPALHQAVTGGNLEVAELLIEHGANINYTTTLACQYCKNCAELTALRAAAGFCGSSNRAFELVQWVINNSQTRGSSVGVLSSIESGALHAAAEKGHNEVVSYFFQISGTVDYVDEHFLTPLHLAVHGGHVETCRLLLEMGARVNMALGGPSPLYIAAIHGSLRHLEILDLLISRGADVNTGCSADQYCYRGLKERLRLSYFFEMVRTTPLAASLKQGYAAVARVLISQGARLIGTEISAAIQLMNFELLSAILNAGGLPDQTDAGQTSLIQQLLTGSESPRASKDTVVRMATALLQAGAPSRAGDVAKAIRQGNTALVDILLSHKAPLSQGDLAEAIRLGSFGLVETMLAHGGAWTRSGGFLEAAILSRNPSMVEVVSKWYPDNYEPGALCAAINTKQELEFIHKLLASRPPEAPAHLFEATSIAMAAHLGKLDLIELLMEYLPSSGIAIAPPEGWKVGERDKPFWRQSTPETLSPLNTALRVSDTPIVRQLLSHGYKPDWNSLVILARRDDISLAKMVLGDSTSISGTVWHADRSAAHIDSPLIHAVHHENREMLRLFIGIGLDVNDKVHNGPHNPVTLLQRAVLHRDLAMVRILLEAGAAVNAPATYRKGYTALKMSVENGHSEMMDVLLRAGADVNAPAGEKYGSTALQKAVENGHSETMDVLLRAGADVNAPAAEEYGATALQRAAIKGHLGIAKHLLELGADPNAPGANFGGRTALEGAAEHGRIDMIELLLHHGVDTTTEDGRAQYIRAVRRATGEGHLVAAKLLRDHGEWTAEDERLMDEPLYR
ncbi:ankyrin repeat-containing domain protein [Echria macrotheca]|uniref:Ankyrin repeat-containing domain protein n=1 Tax=Echria macrotheca TaxID=438768 RepID=A0AAJ0BCS2_9PEZI|nr:ankyrin repeat-containing domain protein [Echria macrotheca]